MLQLEATAELNPTDLRKQLRVEFKDEEGIDEGGVQKEFFQLLIEKLFDPMNGTVIISLHMGMGLFLYIFLTPNASLWKVYMFIVHVHVHVPVN